jgi:hypothetical protein
MVEAYLNEIATAVPDYDVHSKFVDTAPSIQTHGPQGAN